MLVLIVTMRCVRSVGVIRMRDVTKLGLEKKTLVGTITLRRRGLHDHLFGGP